jgi:hypothetical protein
MPKFFVEVTALIHIAVDAETKRQARDAAELLVENLSPSRDFLLGYNSQLEEFGEPARFDAELTGDFHFEGPSEVELA